MRRAALAAIALVVCACGSSSAAARVTPSASAPATTATTPIVTSPSAPASASAPPSVSPAPPASSLIHCTAAVPAGDNLVIGTLAGSQAVVIRDIQNISNPRTLCTIDAAAQFPVFVTGTVIGYITASTNRITEANLATGSVTVMASGVSGSFAFSPDGASMTYVSGSDWHLVNASGNHLLTTLPAVPGRGVDQNNDDFFLRFSPDGQYIALVQTFATGGTGATAPTQVRRASDGSLVFSTSNVTMGVWASVPSRLFFRDGAGNVSRWDPSTGVQAMFTAKWIRPRSSPDGRWIAYTFPTPDGTSTGVAFYSVQSNSVSNTSPPGRAGVAFLNNQLVWYYGVKPCASCFGGYPLPTGTMYIYDIAGASEAVSRITNFFDAWPHTTSPTL